LCDQKTYDLVHPPCTTARTGDPPPPRSVAAARERRHFPGSFFLCSSYEGLFRKMGSKCPMCPQGKNDSRKILAVERTARPKYRQDARRVCKICYTAAVKAGVCSRSLPGYISLAEPGSPSHLSGASLNGTFEITVQFLDDNIKEVVEIAGPGAVRGDPVHPPCSVGDET